MFGFKDIEGTLMSEDNEVLRFRIEHGELMDLDIINRELLPIDFRIADSDRRAFMVFLKERVVEPNRIFLDRVLKSVGIPYYDCDTMLRFNNGFSYTDNYWIRFDSGDQTFNDLKTRVLAIREDWDKIQSMSLF